MFEVGDDGDPLLSLIQVGAKLPLYTTKLELPPCPRISAIVSDAVAWSSRSKLPYRLRCLSGPRQAENNAKRCRIETGVSLCWSSVVVGDHSCSRSEFDSERQEPNTVPSRFHGLSNNQADSPCR